MRSESTDGFWTNLLHPYWVGAFVTLGLGAWLTFPVWGAAPPAGDDVAAHIVRADFAFEHIIGRGHLDGWFPRFMVGYEEFLFYGPGYTWLVGLIRVAGLGALSTAGAVKLAGVLSIVAIAPAVMFLGRSLGLGPPASVAAGLVALAVNSPFGVGLHATYVIGLLPHQVAAAFFCIAIGATVRSVRGRRHRWVAVTALAFAALALTHLITAVITVALGALILMTQLVGGAATPGWWRRLVAGGALALGLTSFWTLPFVAHQDLRGPLTAWRTPALPERIQQIASGEVVFPTGLSAIVLLALLATIWFEPRPRALLGVVPVLYLSIAHAAIAVVPHNALAVQLPNRGVGYAALVAVLAVGVALALASEQTLGRLRRAPPHLLGVAPVIAAGVIAVVFATPARGVVQERGAPTPALAAVATQVRNLVPDGSRFATERDFPAEVKRAGFSHPDLWLAQMSGRDTLNLFNPESSSSRAGFASEEIASRSPDQVATSLARYGVSHVVTVRRATARTLQSDPSFRMVWRRGDFAILALRAPGRVGPFGADGVEGALEVAQPERVIAVVHAPVDRVMTAAVAWSPKWAVRVDGKVVHPRRTDDGIIEFPLPAGRSKVELRFRRDGWDAAGAVVTLATLIGLGLAGLLAYLSRSRSRSRSVSMSSLISRRRSRTA